MFAGGSDLCSSKVGRGGKNASFCWTRVIIRLNCMDPGERLEKGDVKKCKL